MKEFFSCDLNIIKISVVCSVPASGGTPVHINRPTHGLVFYIDGKSCFSFGGKKLRTKKNDVIYLPKHSDYTVESDICENAIRCYAINFEVSDEVNLPPFVMSVKNASAILNLFKVCEHTWQTKNSGFHMECKANLYNIICMLRREFELGYVTSKISKEIEPAIFYIHQKYASENINVGYLAGLCNMSETYFRVNFKKVYGTSPIKYIRDLRIARAKELLSSHMYPTADIAILSGFNDEAYFSREFKKITGVCPSKYSDT